MPEQILIIREDGVYKVYAGFPIYYPVFGEIRGSKTGKFNYYRFGTDDSTNELTGIIDNIKKDGYQNLPIVFQTVNRIEQSFDNLASFELEM